MSLLTRATSDFSVAELKEKLRVLGLSLSGVKSELINRLMEADPSGNWAKDCATESTSREKNTTEQLGGTSIPCVSDMERANMQRKIELCRGEKKLKEDELDLARREIEFLKNVQQLTIGSNNQTASTSRPMMQYETTPRFTASMVADMLNYFDGNSETYET
ncbi:hypothetical protein ANTRET_LOCUS9472 [Anthophora retusa]